MNRFLTLTVTALVTLLVLVSCGDPTDPVENTDPVLSVGTISHFHCELSWTQHNRQDHEFDSYNLYQSESPGIASDTSEAELIASFDEIDQLQHADSLLEAGGDYYYALLTRMHESGNDQDVFAWSNECQAPALDVIDVTIVNNYGQDIHVMVHHNKIIPKSLLEPEKLISFWLVNLGEQALWGENFDQSSCVATVPAEGTFDFVYPEFQNGNGFTWGGPRIYFGEQAFDTVPDLMSYSHIYDKIETNWGPGAVWNTTCVDFFAIPIQISVNSDTIGFLTGQKRASIMTALHDSTYSSLDNVNRFFSPSKKPELVPNILNQAIPTGLLNLVDSTFTWNFTYTVTSTDSNSLSATCGGDITLSNINTESVLACTIDFTHSGDIPEGADANLAGMIGAAANRGVLYDPTLWDDPSNYYINNPSNHNQFNLYSMVLHNRSIDSLCYAFPYDDNHNQDPSLQPINNSGTISPVTITILPKN